MCLSALKAKPVNRYSHLLYCNISFSMSFFAFRSVLFTEIYFKELLFFYSCAITFRCYTARAMLQMFPLPFMVLWIIGATTSAPQSPRFLANSSMGLFQRFYKAIIVHRNGNVESWVQNRRVHTCVLNFYFPKSRHFLDQTTASTVFRGIRNVRLPP